MCAHTTYNFIFKRWVSFFRVFLFIWLLLSQWIFIFSLSVFFFPPSKFYPNTRKNHFRSDSFHCEFIVSMRCNCIVVDAFEWHFYVRLCHSERRREGERELEKERGKKSINYMRLIFSAAVSAQFDDAEQWRKGANVSCRSTSVNT